MNLTDITSGSGDLAIDHIQELRGYVMRGSPVLLSPQAAAYALSCIESNGLINTELEALRAENACLRGAMAASDERLRVHGERVGLFFDCDNPEHMADEILALRAALAAAPRWVSVTERLPDTQETLTVKLDNGHFGYGMYNGAAWVPFNDWRRTVTHWLELPPAPEVTP